jgi:hypothetical protein
VVREFGQFITSPLFLPILKLDVSTLSTMSRSNATCDGMGKMENTDDGRLSVSSWMFQEPGPNSRGLLRNNPG